MISKELIERFEAKFSKTEGCWLWTASTAGRGYGQIKIPGTRRQVYAHVLSYMWYVGQIPDGLFVLHRCDVPRCVNPGHLFLGTSKHNAQDMKAKDRHLWGARNKNHKLTEEQVREIFRCAERGESEKAIAAKFAVTQVTINRIKRGLRWGPIYAERHPSPGTEIH